MKWVQVNVILFTIAAGCFLGGCVASTSYNNSEPYLRPKILEGSYSKLFALVKKVALQTFPDGEMHADSDAGTITITRWNYLRGDTRISITFLTENENSFSVNTTSRGFGSNPPIVDWSTGEVKKFMRALDVAYQRFEKQQANVPSLADQAGTTAINKESKKIPSKYDGFFEAVVIIRSSAGSGSGFFVTSDGYIVTNKHVLSQFDNEVSIKTFDGRNLIGKVIKKGEKYDLALIKVHGSKFSNLKLADKESYQVGTEVLAIGTPLGLDWTLTKGIVSAVRLMNNNILYIQTDTAINKGNSGGPLIILDTGEVIGVNTLIVRGNMAEGLNFAICSSEIGNAFPFLMPLIKN
jgi:S1-C subfamily serine protease